MDWPRVFIGWDEREAVAWHVLNHSIMENSSCPVTVTPVRKSQLSQYYKRDTEQYQSNAFSFTRFLVPWMCNYEGWAIWMDCDMLVLGDIADLWSFRDDNYAVQVVQHKHIPVERTKYLGAEQVRYDRKNWSSVMLFNCARCDALTPEYVATASGLDLHQFKWLEDGAIGKLPHDWNHLVGYDAHVQGVNNAHFTTGGPWFDEYANGDFCDEWRVYKMSMLKCHQREV